MRLIGLALAAAFALCLAGMVACGTRLSPQSAADEQSGQVVSAAGYKAHVDGGPDQLRFMSLYCKSREVLIQAGQPTLDAGVPCR
jgi:hypothetical protein